MSKGEFSKFLLKQESVLIWIMSLSFLCLAFYCIHEGYMGSLPWLAAMVGFPWTAYGVSQMMYYKKAMAENTAGGIKYETILAERQEIVSQYQNASALDYDFELYEEQDKYDEIIDLDECRI
jgi:hypothetical protein